MLIDLPGQLTCCCGILSSYVHITESPRWLLAHGRTLEARLILAQLTSRSALSTDDIVIAQSREIEDAIALERKAAGDFRYMELFQGGEMQNFRRMCLCFGIQMMQQVRSAIFE